MSKMSEARNNADVYKALDALDKVINLSSQTLDNLYVISSYKNEKYYNIRYDDISKFVISKMNKDTMYQKGIIRVMASLAKSSPNAFYSNHLKLTIDFYLNMIKNNKNEILVLESLVKVYEAMSLLTSISNTQKYYKLNEVISILENFLGNKKYQPLHDASIKAHY